MQVIVEDYVHGGWKVPLLLLNTFFSIFVGAAIDPRRDQALSRGVTDGLKCKAKT